METISVTTSSRFQMIDITRSVHDVVRKANVRSGIAVVFIPHTTAAVTINENADPSVVRDITATLNRVIPENDRYTHMEGNSQAHILSSLVGASEHIVIENGDLVLGTWQGIYFCEYDGPRTRKAHITVVGA